VRRDDPNREYPLVVASALGDLCNEVVFVGGSVAGLLITDPVAEDIRATKDVDAIIEATTLGQYHQVEKRLPASGFNRDASSEVICRATKLEAFVSRGGSDILSSHDLEDILNVIDGRPSIVDEMMAATDALQKYVGEQFTSLLSRSDIENYLPGLLTDENRVGVVLSRLRSMAA
jgi:hypothetical protein